MKQFLLLMSLMLTLQASSQPIMNNLYNFTLGHTYNYKKVDVGWNIDTSLIPTIGNNLTWNFDTLTLMPTVYTDSILDPVGTAGAAFFTNAAFVWKEYSGLLQYYKKSNDTVYYMGNYSSWPSIFNPFPISTVNNTPISSGYLYSNFQTTVGGSPWTYDARYNAYGTIKLPGGISLSNIGLYVTVGGNATARYADYFWFKENQNDPVLRIQFKWTSTASTVQYVYVNTTALVSSVAEVVPQQELKVFPNPATDKINIQSYIDGNAIEIRNVFGQVQMSKPVTENKFTIDISSWPTGYYFIRITNVKGMVQLGSFLK